MRLGIVGSRTFTDYEKLNEWMRLFDTEIDLIVSGGAEGADTLAEIYADNAHILTKVISPDWWKYGKQAGFLRNTEIVANSDVIMAFWDGKSRGTKDTIDKARIAKKPTIIIYV